MTPPIGIGVDIGSQGMRVLAADSAGIALAKSSTTWSLRRAPEGIHEQDPRSWSATMIELIRRVCDQLGQQNRESVRAISVTATSGTVVISDERLQPLRPAIMWDDKRAAAEAEDCADAGADLAADLGYRFRPTFSLPKLLWIARHEPRLWDRTRYACHATEWLASQLTAEPPVCDFTNALKSGYDLLHLRWPTVLDRLGLDKTVMPPVVAAGTPVGTVTRRIAITTGLSPETIVVAGMTDANTAQVASGAYDLGQWVTTIGTGLSMKGVSPDLVKDPRGVLYSHRHPEGHWIPSGTSHSGADAITVQFAGSDLETLTSQAASRPAGAALVFPLASQGEYFPFWAPDATGFVVGDIVDQAALFRCYLEGIAYIERLSYELVTALGMPIAGAVTTVGGGSRSRLWQQIRSDVLDRPVRAAVNPETALGAALVAISSECGGITASARSAARYSVESTPRPAERELYEDRYQRFIGELARRGYLDRDLGKGRAARGP